MTEFVYLVVDFQFFFNVGVRARNVGFGLIIIVITDEKFDSVFGEKFAEFVAELRRKRLVVRDDERRTLQALDYVRHSKGLAAAGDSEQDFGGKTAFQTRSQTVDCRGLVAAGGELAYQFEGLHSPESF